MKVLSEGEEIVVSAQFMLDSESRLQEAIQKMLEIRSRGGQQDAADDLDMTDMDMDGDLDMTDMTMDNAPEKAGTGKN